MEIDARITKSTENEFCVSQSYLSLEGERIFAPPFPSPMTEWRLLDWLFLRSTSGTRSAHHKVRMLKVGEATVVQLQR